MQLQELLVRLSPQMPDNGTKNFTQLPEQVGEETFISALLQMLSLPDNTEKELVTSLKNLGLSEKFLIPSGIKKEPNKKDIPNLEIFQELSIFPQVQLAPTQFIINEPESIGETLQGAALLPQQMTEMLAINNKEVLLSTTDEEILLDFNNKCENNNLQNNLDKETLNLKIRSDTNYQINNEKIILDEKPVASQKKVISYVQTYRKTDFNSEMPLLEKLQYGSQKEVIEIPKDTLKNTDIPKQTIKINENEEVNPQTGYSDSEKHLFSEKNQFNFHWHKNTHKNFLEHVKFNDISTLEPEVPVKEIPEFLLKQISQKVKFNKLDGSSQLSLKLKPAELGKMTLQLSVNNGQVTVKILTENNQARDLVDQNLTHLKQSLVNQGMKLGSIDVQVGTDSSFNQFMGHQFNPFNQSRQSSKNKFLNSSLNKKGQKVEVDDFTEHSRTNSKLGLSTVEIFA
ncbi:MAG: flagellar hook-length control protein FliK [Clostridia bacterium]|nr:flagellar hook-length control protein FliK [Clostridia bacterium]